MEKRIKYLNYRVLRNNQLLHSGTVPEILALSGLEKTWNLGGVWLNYRHNEETILEFSDGNRTIAISSKSTEHEWVSYVNKIDQGLLQEKY